MFNCSHSSCEIGLKVCSFERGITFHTSTFLKKSRLTPFASYQKSLGRHYVDSMMELRRGGAGANPCVLKVGGKGGEVSRKKWTKLLPCGQDFIFWDEGEGADNVVVASYIRAFHVILRLQPKVNRVLKYILCITRYNHDKHLHKH